MLSHWICNSPADQTELPHVGKSTMPKLELTSSSLLLSANYLEQKKWEDRKLCECLNNIGWLWSLCLACQDNSLLCLTICTLLSWLYFLCAPQSGTQWFLLSPNSEEEWYAAPHDAHSQLDFDYAVTTWNTNL